VESRSAPARVTTHAKARIGVSPCSRRFHFVRFRDEKSFVSVSHKVIHGISTIVAMVQMIVRVKLAVQIELFVDQFQKSIEVACAHIFPPIRSYLLI
jgi:hypothetical protein